MSSTVSDKQRFSEAVWEIMDQILEVNDIGAALSGTLEIIAKVIRSETGAIWLLQEDTGMIYPLYCFGSADVSEMSVENGEGVEGIVTRTGQSSLIQNVAKTPKFPGTIFEELGVVPKTMLTVPLKALGETIGCIQLINKTDGSVYDEEERELVEHMSALTVLTIEDKGLPVPEREEKEVLISLVDVEKEFQNPGGISKVLKGINLDIYKGELLVVVGESGCGKSTMVNIIGGMDYLTTGKLLVEGKDYSHPSDQELTMFRRHYIGFIFQSYNLMPNLSAYDNIRFIAEISEDPMPVEETLKLVGLAEKGGSFPAMMSGGQQQRVAIARALVKNPKLILADEPTAALDYETSIEVLSAIENISRTRGTTVIMITHNPEIGKMADRVIKLRNGRVFSIRKNAHPLHADQLEW